MLEVGTGASRDALVIDAQPVAEVLEDAGHGPGTDLDAESGQFSSDLLSGAARPADTGNGIAGDIVLEWLRWRRLPRATGWRPPPGRRTRWLDVAGQQLLAPPGHGAGVETEQLGDAAVTAVADFERFKCGVETALAFVEQGIEQDDGGAQLVGHDPPDRADGRSGRRGLDDVSGAQLGMVVLAVGREVDPAEADLGAPDATLESQLAQWILDLDVQQVLTVK